LGEGEGRRGEREFAMQDAAREHVGSVHVGSKGEAFGFGAGARFGGRAMGLPEDVRGMRREAMLAESGQTTRVKGCCGPPLMGFEDADEELPEDMPDCCRRGEEKEARMHKMLRYLKETSAPHVEVERRHAADPHLAIMQRGVDGAPRGAGLREDDGSGEEEEWSDGDDEFLARLREERLAELKRSSKAGAKLQTAGTKNTLVDVPEWELHEDAALAHPRVVCHLVRTGSGLGAEADEVLERLCSSHAPGTKFIRTLPSHGSPLLGLFGLRPQDLPALVFFEAGELAAVMPCHRLVHGGGAGDEGGEPELSTERLEAFLARAGALGDDAKGAYLARRAARAAGVGEDADDEEEDDGPWGVLEEAPEGSGVPGNSSAADPCRQCGRTYPHTHVRSINSGFTSTGDDQDDDGY